MTRRTWIALAGAGLAAAVLVSLVGAATSSGGSTPRCEHRKATIVGTSDGDTIYGTNGTDVIVAKGGRDNVYGAGGDDYICGGGGRDILVGGSGDDFLSGEKGGDALFGGSGDDVEFGGDDSDSLSGGSGEDYLGGDTLLPYRNDVCDGGDGSNDTALGDCETKKNVP
jgi:Ca2+-binding RTX toxin-like protein